MVAAYYNIFIIVMAIFMLMGGVLLTALAYRPKEIAEDWWEWTERFYRSKNSRIVGPALMVTSLVLIMAMMGYCGFKSHKRKRMLRMEEDESSDCKSEIISWKFDQENLLAPTSDIACFPDGSPR